MRERERYDQLIYIISRSLSHPNLVQFYGMVEKGGEMYIVTEYVPGEKLSFSYLSFSTSSPILLQSFSPLSFPSCSFYYYPSALIKLFLYRWKSEI